VVAVSSPVVRYAGKTETVDASIVSCPVWNAFIRLCQHEPMCNASVSEYTQWEDDISRGVVGLDETYVPLKMI
jgi:hypothetical protein